MSDTSSIKRLAALSLVLSQTRDVICDIYGIDEAEAFRRTEVFIKTNSEKWRLSTPDIDYADPFCRMAYLYMNVAVHASLMEQAMSSYPEISELIQRRMETGSEMQICMLGGGPGSELLGIVKYINGLKLGRTVHLDLVLVDRIKEWDESWHALKLGLDSQLKLVYGDDRGRWPTSVSRSFLPLDVTNEADFIHFATRFGAIDLFVVCYLVSELKTALAPFQRVLERLISRASPTSLILFIDRDERDVRQAVQTLVATTPSLSSLGVKNVRGKLEDTLNELGEWYINIPSLPRQNWLAFFHLAQRTSALRGVDSSIRV